MKIKLALFKEFIPPLHPPSPLPPPVMSKNFPRYCITGAGDEYFGPSSLLSFLAIAVLVLLLCLLSWPPLPLLMSTPDVLLLLPPEHPPAPEAGVPHCHP